MIGCHYEQGVRELYSELLFLSRARVQYILYTRMRAYKRVLPH